MNDDLFIGVMSGTSLDAIDCVLTKFPKSIDNKIKIEIIHHHSFKLPQDIKRQLLSLNYSRDNELELMLKMDVYLGHLIADACNTLLTQANISSHQVTAIGSHGQTIRHYPEGEFHTTLQIGDANIIAEKTGITTIADFRRRDIAAGGQGAPLVPPFHEFLFYDENHSTCTINIGGISNITLLSCDRSKPILGFDTGPGNTLLDLFCQNKFNCTFDNKGEIAKTGNIQKDLLEHYLLDPFFTQEAPKSTGRDYFGGSWLENKHQEFRQANSLQATDRDILATLTELTAITIINEIIKYQADTKQIIICGGGAKNTYLLSRLSSLAKDIKVFISDQKGYPSQQIESLAFAWLAKQTMQGLTANIPSVTGAKHKVILGAIYQK